MRDELQRAVDLAGQYPAMRFGGSGIVICSGGSLMLTNAYVLVRILRERHGCRLPIEIWHLGPREMPGVMADLLSAMGCTIIDALSLLRAYPAEIHDGWQLKPYALIHSSFEEVILLDADQVPLIDPATMLGWPEYRETGAVFWPDIIDLSPDNPVWALVGLEPRHVRSWETGQACIDKRRHWRSLAMVLRMNERADTFYRLVYGDKDTFLVAWLLAGASHSVVPHPPMADQKFLGQRDFSGAVVLQHRSNCKFNLHEPPYRSDALMLQDECEEMLEDLAQVWNGIDFEPPARSAKARQREHELVARRRFSLFIDRQPPSSLELLPGRQIGVGRTDALQNWYVREGSKGLELVFHGHHRPSFVLSDAGDESWRGRASRSPPRMASLTPLGSEPAEGDATTTRHLADDFVDAALRNAPAGNIDAATLEAAMSLLAQVEPGVAKRMQARADEIAIRRPGAADQLRAIAENLPRPSRRETRPDKTTNRLFDDPRHYRRPSAFREEP